MIRRDLVLSVFLVIALLGGCADPTASLESSIELRVAPGASIEPLLATFIMIDPTLAFAGDLASPAQLAAAVREPAPGVYLTEPVPFDEAGRARVTLPSASDVPTSTLAEAAEALAFLLSDDSEDCGVASSDPQASVSYLVDGFSWVAPGITASSLLGYDVWVVSEAPITSEDFDGGTFSFVSWIYADGATDVTTVGTDCGIAVSLDLEQGWNAVRWQVGGPILTVGVIVDLDGPLYLSSLNLF